MEQSTEIKELAQALAIAQGKIKNAIKESNNPYFNSKYADLASVWKECREPLSQNGLSVIQTGNVGNPDVVVVITQLLHSSGQWIRGEFSARPVKQDPQAIGSCITYLRRYSLAAMVGVAPDDDDGNAASQGRQKLMGEPAPPDSTGPIKINKIEDLKMFTSPPPNWAPNEILSPATHCMFGKNSGVKWVDMDKKQLEFYLGLFKSKLADPSKIRDKADNEAALLAINLALESMETDNANS